MPNPDDDRNTIEVGGGGKYNGSAMSEIANAPSHKGIGVSKKRS